jgi:hypothetical protein
MVERGELSGGDLVWKEGMADWVDCATVQGLLPAARASVADGGPEAWNPYQSPTADGTAPTSAVSPAAASTSLSAASTVASGAP